MRERVSKMASVYTQRYCAQTECAVLPSLSLSLSQSVSVSVAVRMPAENKLGSAGGNSGPVTEKAIHYK